MREGRWLLVSAVVAFGTLLPELPLSAQVVRGQVVDGATKEPIQGAFILLLDSAGIQQAAVLSDPAGAFILRSPRPGRYALRAERIGYSSTDSEWLRLEEGRALVYRFEVSVEAVDLEGLQVTGRRGRCDMRRDVGAQTSLLWEEIRKALSIASWGDEVRGVPYRTATWTRLRNVRSLHVLDDTARLRSGYDRAAFASETAQRLGALGFIREVPEGGLMFYGLDAEELLSDDFLARHCFHVVEDEAHPELAGLAFEPLPSVRPPDILGTLWVDRATSALRTLEFTYNRIPIRLTLPPRTFGGQVDFRRLDNGDWVVSRWWLRMPETTRSGEDLHIREKGGEILFIGNAAPAGAEATFTISGTVYDSTAMAPLGDATVFLTDVNVATKTDVFGRFRLDHVPRGAHRIAFLHPRTDFLRWPIGPREVTVGPGQSPEIALGLPSTAGCRLSDDTGGIVGFVESAETGELLARWRVQVTWSKRAAGGGGRVTRKVRASTDSNGRFLVCGLPRDTELSLAAEGGRTSKISLDLPGLSPQTLVAPGPGQ